jgi:hypothetical protein
MIIKSMSRKTASFSQLINYLNKGKVADDDYFFRHNIYSHTPYYISKEYQENYKNLKRRANSNALYHEIISLKHQKNLSIEEQREILKDLMSHYTNTRANNNMVYGVIHEQHNQIHCHLMVSSNELASDKNKRFSRKEFAEIKAALWNYAHEKYPELVQEKKASKKTRAKTKVIDNEVQYKKRTGKKSDREIIKERLQAIFSRSKNPQAFISTLEKEKIQVYQRGKTFGFLDESSGKKYRLKTLELEKEFSDMNKSFTEFTKEAVLNEKQRTGKANQKTNNENKKTDNDNQRTDKANQKTSKESVKDRHGQEFDRESFDRLKSREQEKFRAQIHEARRAQIQSFTKSQTQGFSKS